MAQVCEQELLSDLDYRIAVIRSQESITSSLNGLKPGEERVINLESLESPGLVVGTVRISRT